jgi:hypothetical protein
MAIYYPVMWLAAIFLCILSGFRGWLYVSSLSILSLLTDTPCQKDRCEKRARQFRRLPKRFYISPARKLPVWMHIALCIVGFMSFTVLIWFMLIYGYVRFSPSTAWKICELRGLPSPKVLPGCLPDSAAIGCCCTPTLLRPSLLSTTFDSAAAMIGEESSRFDHTWHRVSFLCNPSHCCSNGSFLKLYPGPSSNTFLLLNLHFASESSKSELLQPYSAEMWMKNAPNLPKNSGLGGTGAASRHCRGGPSRRPLPRRLLCIHPTFLLPLCCLTLSSCTQREILAISKFPLIAFLYRAIATWPPSLAVVAALHPGPAQLRLSNSPAVTRLPFQQHEPQSTAFLGSVPQSQVAACPRSHPILSIPLLRKQASSKGITSLPSSPAKTSW